MAEINPSDLIIQFTIQYGSLLEQLASVIF